MHPVIYGEFYGLRERPFDLVPNPRFLYLTPRQREAFSNLRYGLSVPKGLTLLLGEAGTGKTTLVQSILYEIDRGRIECVLVSNPTLTRPEFYEYLALAFGLSPEAAHSKARFLLEFRRHLLARHEAGQLSAIVVDEAQSLPYELLEEVRLLGNIETASVKLLNVVLAGQPELADRLNEPRLRQLKQRVGLRCELKPFDLRETAAYVAGRLRIANGDPAEIFTREAILAIHEASRGVPRAINVICDNALLGGFAAQVKPISHAMVAEVRRDFDLNGSNGHSFGLRDKTPTFAPPVRPPHVRSSTDGRASGSTQHEPDGAEAPMFGQVTRSRRLTFF
jgi:type II secretory pathway predicted ATPase ExeA